MENSGTIKYSRLPLYFFPRTEPLVETPSLFLKEPTHREANALKL